MAAIVGAWIAGALVATSLLEFGAYWCHFWLHGTHGENWWFLHTFPVGALFGGLLAVRLLRWTVRLEELQRWPGGSRGAWCGLAPAIFLLTIGLLLGLILISGHLAPFPLGYLPLVGPWLLLLWLASPPRASEG